MGRHIMKQVLCCASVVALAGAATPASAQQVDRIVAFGDSLADSGNALQLLLSNPGLPPATRTQLQTLYSTGRFSGGTNYIDTLSQLLGAPSLNYAVGGAQTGTLNQFGPIPGFTQETAIFLSGATPPGTIFPANGGFQEGDLLALSVGINDARAFFQNNPNATTAQAEAAAGTSVVNATNNLNLLVGAGAPTISYVALNGGLTPDVLANPSAKALGTAFSNTFNAGFQTTLAGYAADGVTVHYLDGATVLANVAANPAAYGITNLYCPTPTPAAPGCILNQQGYLFYADGIHPTSDGMRIIAQYVAAQLAAPLTLQAPSELAMDTARQWGRTLSSRADVSGRSAAPGIRLFVVGDTFSRGVKATSDNSPFDMDGYGGTVGAEFGVGLGAVGIAANYSRPRVRFGDGSARVNGRSYQLGAYGSASLGGLFGQAHLGFGKDKHRINRAGVIDSMAARPGGSHVTAGAKAGYLMPFGVAQFGPIAALDYARVKVDGYTEAGDPALTLNVSSQRYKSLTGQLGLEARAGFAGISPFVAATAEHEFAGDDRAIAFSQTASPIIVNSWEVERKRETYGRLTGGMRATLFGALSLDANVTSTFGRDGGEEVGAQLGIRAGF